MPANQTPEQISGAQPEWNSSTQAFTVRLTAQYGAAEAADAGAFQVSGTLTVTDSTSGEVVGKPDGGPQPVEAADSRDPGGDRPLSPLIVSWDRNGGTYTGTARVSGEVRLLSPSGAVVHTGQIDPSTTDVR